MTAKYPPWTNPADIAADKEFADECFRDGGAIYPKLRSLDPADILKHQQTMHDSRLRRAKGHFETNLLLLQHMRQDVWVPQRPVPWRWYTGYKAVETRINNLHLHIKELTERMPALRAHYQHLLATRPH